MKPTCKSCTGIIPLQGTGPYAGMCKTCEAIHCRAEQSTREEIWRPHVTDYTLKGALYFAAVGYLLHGRTASLFNWFSSNDATIQQKFAGSLLLTGTAIFLVLGIAAFAFAWHGWRKLQNEPALE